MISRTSCRRSRHRAALRQALAALFLTLSPTLALAQIRVDTGYNALSAQLGGAVPTGAGVVVTQVEAPSGGYQPSSTTSGTGNFEGKTFAFRSSASTLSGHAAAVGNNFYGNSSALAPGITTIDSYEAGDWLGVNPGVNSNVLQYNTPNNPLVSLNGSRVVNHSWIYTGANYLQALELLERNDWLIATDDIIQVAGTNNGSSSINQALFAYGANTISVGLSNLNHGKGTPTALTPTGTGGHQVYGLQGTYQHPRPDLVVPESATSWATPVVGSAAALLIQASKDNPTWSTTSYVSPRIPTQTIRAADTSEVIRAALLAGADRMYYNTDGVRLLDYRGSASVEAANGLDTRVGAGQLNIRNSYNILAGTQQIGAATGNGTAIADAGFDYDAAFGGDASSNNVAKYTFTGGWTGQNFAAALVWNANIEIGDITGFGGVESAANIHDFNLKLWDISTVGSPVLVAQSISDRENTENIFTSLVAGKNYQLEVSSVNLVNWDYGLAWNGISNQLWNGTGGNNTWNVASAATWQRGTNATATFLDHDQVVFNDTAANTTVNIGSAVAPAIITVDNTAKNYIFGGTGSITGGALIKKGTGSLTFNNTNSYGGDTLLQAGSIRAGVANALSANSAVELAGGTTLDLLGNDNTVKHLTGTGTVQATGATLGIAPNASAAFAGTLVNPATLNKTQTGTQAFTGNLQWQATNINVQGGTLQFNLSNASTVSLTAGTNVAVQAGATLELAGTKSALSNGMLHAPVVTQAANAAVSVTGTNQIVGALTGPTSGPFPFGSALGTTMIASGANLTATRIRQSALTINDTGRATIASNGGDSGVSVVSTLTIAGGVIPTATLDLTNNDLILDYTGGVGSLLSTLTAQIKSARNGTDLSDQALWTGAGITSSTIRTVNLGFGSDRYNLGIVDNAAFGELGISTSFLNFSGVPIDTSSLLVKYTLNGDAYLDGVVTADDYTFWVNGYLSNGTRGGWLYGDFNYDGAVTSNDYTLWLNSYLAGGGVMSASLAIPAIPEPTTWVALLGVGFGAWIVRRKK